MAHRSRMKARVVAVTGSAGKTTTKGMVASVLGQRYQALAAPGNWNTEIGVPLTLLMLEPWHEVAVLEMAMRGRGQIAYLVGVASPEMGIITNIGEAHLELLGSIENIALAKAELIQGLPAGGLAVLNGDDPWQRRIAHLTAAPVLWYGFEEDCAVTAIGITEDTDDGGAAFEVVFKGHEAIGSRPFRIPVSIPLPGRHHVMDALAAVAAGAYFGIEPEGIAVGLRAANSAVMRWQLEKAGPCTLINDAYNANPASMKASLRALAARQAGTGRRIAVLGDMLELGARAEAAHREVGEEAARMGLDVLVTVGSLSRGISEGARAAGMPAERVYHFPSSDDAARFLTGELRKGDVVLFKGSRGVRLELMVAAVRQALKATDVSGTGGEGR